MKDKLLKIKEQIENIPEKYLVYMLIFLLFVIFIMVYKG